MVNAHSGLTPAVFFSEVDLNSEVVLKLVTFPLCHASIPHWWPFQARGHRGHCCSIIESVNQK